MHDPSSPRSLRAQLLALSPQERQRVLESLSPEAAETLLRDWQLHARDAQLPPPGDWSVWLILAGRGFGKTRTGVEWVRDRVRRGMARRIALIAPTAADARDTMVEGESGILACSSPDDRPIYEPSKRRLTWPCGAIGTLFSAEEPDRLRGPQHDTAWGDEIAAWKYAEDAWSNLLFGLRLGDPRVCVTTTPRPVPLLKQLLKDPATRTTRGSTFDNAANLSPKAVEKLRKIYEGTRLGRQELFAELLEDTPGALWTLSTFERHRVAVHPDLVRVAVAVDPQAADPKDNPDSDKAAETGIVAGGIDARGEGYVLRDASGRFGPAEWGERAVLLHDELKADHITVEVNQGGAMATHVLRGAAEKLWREKKRPTKHLVIVPVHASRGKATRAEPIASLDEQGRIHHVGTHARLEDQCATWVPGSKSPDRLDARVWLFTDLMLGDQAADPYTEIAAALGDVHRRDATGPARSAWGEDDEDDGPAFSRRE